jgi:hypothetical protein
MSQHQLTQQGLVTSNPGLSPDSTGAQSTHNIDNGGEESDFGNLAQLSPGHIERTEARRVALKTELARHPDGPTRSDYDAYYRAKIYGTANPSIMNNPLWNYSIKQYLTPENLRLLFDYEDSYIFNDEKGPDFGWTNPAWCHSRMGATSTKLPDGRTVNIGGEYEDYYDPEFAIYNDVVVFSSNAVYNDADNKLRVVEMGDAVPTIYGYPKDVFPPIDFHTATLITERTQDDTSPTTNEECIILIGGLGYQNGNSLTTNVYRLNLGDFSTAKVETHGKAPDGRTHEHLATLVEDQQRGKGVEIHRTDGSVFILRVPSMNWEQQEDRPFVHEPSDILDE